MNERLRKAFEEITPLSCDRELYESTLGKAEAMREISEDKRRKVNKPFVAVCAAAAALAVGTVSIGAYYDWDFGKVLSSWLGNTDRLHEVMSAVSVPYEMNSFDNLDIKVGGGLTDGNMSIIFLDITRTDGGIFDMSDYLLEFEDGSAYSDKKQLPKATFDNFFCTGERELTGENTYTNPLIYAKQCFIEDDDPTDNRLIMALAWTERKDSASKGVEISLSDLKLTKMTVDYEYSKNPEEKYIVGKDNAYESFKGSYNATISLENLSADVRSAEVSESVALNFYNHAQTVEELKHYDIDFTLDSVRVSPMTVNFKAHREIPDERHYLTLNSSIGYVTLRNGSVVAIADGYEKPSFNNETGNGSPNCASGQLVYEKPKFIERWDIDCSFMLEEAVDLKEVVSVTIGGTTIMLD